MSNFTAKQRVISALTWRAPQDPNGEINTYEVIYTVNDTDIITVNTTDRIIIEPETNTRISDISVRAYTSIGPGNATKLPDVETLELPTTCAATTARDVSVTVVLTSLLYAALLAAVGGIYQFLYNSNRKR